MITLHPKEAEDIVYIITNYFERSPSELKRFQLITGLQHPREVYPIIQADPTQSQIYLQKYMHAAFDPLCYNSGTIGRDRTNETYVLLNTWGVPRFMYDSLRYYTKVILLTESFRGKYMRYAKRLLSAIKKLDPMYYAQSNIAMSIKTTYTTAQDDSTRALILPQLVEVLEHLTQNVSDVLSRIGCTTSQQNLLGY